MKLRIRFMTTLGVVLLAVQLCACTSSSSGNNEDNSGGVTYRGNTADATVSDGNSRELGETSLQAMDYSRDNQQAQNVVAGDRETTNPKSLALIPASRDGTCGGSVDTQATAGGYVRKYADYCMDAGLIKITITGTVTVENSADSKTVSTTYDDLHVTMGEREIVLNGATSFDTGTGKTNSHWEFVVDGKTYRSEDYELSGNDSAGYKVDGGKVYNEDLGAVTVTTERPVVFEGCDNGKPIDGKLVFQGAGDSVGSIEFMGCEQYQVCSGDPATCNDYTWSK